MFAVAKYQAQCVFRFLDLVCRALKPPLRPEGICVRSEDLLIPEQTPGTPANPCACRDEDAIENVTTRWYFFG
jgi:hypothetical protein